MKSERKSAGVAIEFAPERLTGCRRNSRGAEFWDIEGLIRFHPRGELVHGGLMEEIRTGGVVTAHSPKRLEVAVPSDTTQIEMWFLNFAEIGGRCDAWDSRFGENYWFDVGGPSRVTYFRRRRTGPACARIYALSLTYAHGYGMLLLRRGSGSMSTSSTAI